MQPPKTPLNSRKHLDLSTSTPPCLEIMMGASMRHRLPGWPEVNSGRLPHVQVPKRGRPHSYGLSEWQCAWLWSSRDLEMSLLQIQAVMRYKSQGEVSCLPSPFCSASQRHLGAASAFTKMDCHATIQKRLANVADTGSDEIPIAGGSVLPPLPLPLLLSKPKAPWGCQCFHEDERPC